MPKVTDISAMSAPTEDASLAMLSDRALSLLLDAAELEERDMSDRRAKLHALIDARHVAANASDEDLDLAELSRQEREISADRLYLHQRILDIRLEKSRRVDGVRMPLGDSAR
jgi:hypothetical protein